ncbi:hypothetical protein BLL52_0820 [Rhodoferax antarcticus ANT.BR]|uniref:Uncharacterized protein n=1 Tax=Rhodoferax antarcticus ANT.BR TaxID=1111071 RepID=A0A1Q8YI34_9BURK|nr:hypothetical protein BLL52_0820 [Rhodoferax antarcticus ANT.BR]
MQDEHSILEFHGVNSAVRPAYVVFDNLKHTSTAKALEHLCRTMLIATLRKIQGVTKKLPHLRWKKHQVFFTAPNPDQRSFL